LSEMLSKRMYFAEVCVFSTVSWKDSQDGRKEQYIPVKRIERWQERRKAKLIIVRLPNRGITSPDRACKGALLHLPLDIS